MENPFAPLPDSRATPTDAVWLDGDELCTRNHATWPSRCVVCGQDTPADNPLRVPLQWHPRWVYFLVLISLWIYLIAAMVTRRRAAVHVFLCDQHRSRRRNGQVVLAASLLVGLAMTVVGVAADRLGIVGFGMLALLVGVIAGALMTRTVRATRMDGETIWVKAGAGFVATL